ncbi:MAG: hypothetical protein J6R31_01335 [Rikenellaceae bacterium]|nr:hypothetical protein [Rikenellaceae bacterium]
MKKLILMVLVAIPLVCSAQFKYGEVKNNPKYLSPNAVLKQSNTKDIYIQGVVPYPASKNVSQAKATVEALLGENGTLIREGATCKLVSKNDNALVYQITDELVFNRNFITSDVAQMTATLIVSFDKDQHFAFVVMKNIIYRTGSNSEQLTGMPHESWKSVYSASDDPVQVVAAEQMISDEIALNRKGELVRSIAKYRVKTIDYFYDLAGAIALHLEK